MQIGPFRVVRPLGRGGMASVYLATSPGGDEVVLKVPHRSVPGAAGRLVDEAKLGMRLKHPCIVRTLDIVEHEGGPVLVLEYIRGPSLSQWRREAGALPASFLVRVGRQIAEALDVIHSATGEGGKPLDALHRDVTPGNILIGPGARATLIDLGIAKVTGERFERTATGKLPGTLRFLAPELVEGQPYSTATDLWALGLVLFECALGRRSIDGDTRAILAGIATGRVTELRAGEVIDPYLDAGLSALLCPAERRIAAAREAARLFGGLEARLGAPPSDLMARFAAEPTDDDHEEETLPMQAAPPQPEPSPRAAPSDEEATGRTVPEAAKPTLQIPAVDVEIDAKAVDDAAKPTLQMPVVKIVPDTELD